MTLQERCVAILRDLLKREPTENEIGNVMTDAHIVNQALAEQAADQAAVIETQAATLDSVSTQLTEVAAATPALADKISP